MGPMWERVSARIPVPASLSQPAVQALRACGGRAKELLTPSDVLQSCYLLVVHPPPPRLSAGD